MWGRSSIMTRSLSSNGDLPSNFSLQNELELLLLQQQHEREMDLHIHRSGSAPPTVEGALRSARNLFNNPNFDQFDSGGSIAAQHGFLTEEKIRSHPAYVEYYYSHENLNPRLPPPLLSKEDWRVAQRVRTTGFGLGSGGDWLNTNLIDNSGSSSSVSVHVKKAEDELVELRKAALKSLARESSSELTDRSFTGLVEVSSSGMGVRRKSFADILQEGLGRPVTPLIPPRPASQNSMFDVFGSKGGSGTNAAERKNKVESFEIMPPEKAFTGLPSGQNFGSTLPSSFASSVSLSLKGSGVSAYLSDNVNSMTLGARNVSSSGIFDVTDIADSLSGLSMSKDQLHMGDISKSSLQMRLSTVHQPNQQHPHSEKSNEEKMVNNINYDATSNNGVASGFNISKSVVDEQILPRRGYSTANLQFQLSPSDLASREDLKILYQRNNFPDVNVSSDRHSGYAINQIPDMMINNVVTKGSLLTGITGDGQNMRNGNLEGIFYNAIGPDQFQDLLRRSAARIPGNSSGGKSFGSLHGLENLQPVEKAYLEALLMQQKQQYMANFLHKPNNSTQDYHGIPAPGPCATLYHGNRMANSLHPTSSSRSPMFQNERSVQFPSTSRKIKGESISSIHAQSGNNMKSKFELLLEVAKNNKTKSLELSDVIGHVAEFSTDQYGSRYIQQKLETATSEEKMRVFVEIIPHALSLMTDVFGNYVIQKFFEHGTDSQRKELCRHLIGHVLPLSLQMYGCRVIQKALEVVDVELQTKMVVELDGSVMKCIGDQNGNHVIQKSIECVPEDRIQFIISSFFGQVVTLSTHPYGCRVIQRVLEHCNDSKTQQIIMDEIMSSVCYLAQDQYGNYVLQHVLQRGKPHERSAIINKLAGQIVKMSQQKFASNVIEKCLTFGSPDERKMLVNEILGSTDENEPLQAMMKDPFGNYVVQKVLETCDDRSRELILSRIKVHLTALKKYTYGKHIVSRVEKLVAAGERQIEFSSK